MTKSAQLRSGKPATRKVPPQLVDALWQYHIDSDVHALRRAHDLHLASKEKPNKISRFFDAIERATNWFEIVPHHRTRLPAKKTDAEAIGVDWIAVGKDLNRAITKHILHEAEAGEKNK